MKNIMLFTLISLLLSMCVSAQTVKQDVRFSQKKTRKLSTGITMRYVDVGKGKVPILFLHGYTDTSRSFELMIEDLAANEAFRMIAPDLRGHGETSLPDASVCRSTPEACFTMQVFAADVVDLLDQLEISRVYVVAHSMGSVLAQELALTYPDRIVKMVLMGTFVSGKKCATTNEYLPQLVEKTWKPLVQNKDKEWPESAYTLTASDLGDMVTDFIRKEWVTEVSADTTYLEYLYKGTIQIPLATWIGVSRALYEVDNTVRLQQLKTPTLILWATQDVVTNESDQLVVKEAFGKAAGTGTEIIFKTYGKLPVPTDGSPLLDFGHNFHWGAHHAVAQDVVSFIRTGEPVKTITYVGAGSKIATEHSDDVVVHLR